MVGAVDAVGAGGLAGIAAAAVRADRATGAGADAAGDGTDVANDLPPSATRDRQVVYKAIHACDITGISLKYPAAGGRILDEPIEIVIDLVANGRTKRRMVIKAIEVEIRDAK